VPITPVIVVPGVLGTRLSMPSGSDWDPDSNIAMLQWTQHDILTKHRDLNVDLRPNADILTTFSTAAADQISNNQDLVNIAAARQRDTISLFSFRGWAGLAWAFYGNLLIQLETKLNVTGSVFTNESLPVYAFGYDWRKSNAISSQALSTFTNQVLSTEGADQAILVTHSMGGLVARAEFQQDAAFVSKVRGVVHVCMPSNGSVTAYRRFFTGCISPFDFPGDLLQLIPDRLTDFLLAIIMGQPKEAFATLMSGLPGPMELLPNDSYAAGEPSWLATDPQIDLTDVFSAYKGPFQPGIISDSLDIFLSGVGGGLTGEFVKAALAARISSAQQFHGTVGSTTHPHTIIMSSTGLTTDETVSFVGNMSVNQTATGDGTVNIASASCPTLDAGSIEANTSVNGLEHAKVFADDAFMLALVSHVNHFVLA